MTARKRRLGRSWLFYWFPEKTGMCRCQKKVINNLWEEESEEEGILQLKRVVVKLVCEVDIQYAGQNSTEIAETQWEPTEKKDSSVSFTGNC